MFWILCLIAVVVSPIQGAHDVHSELTLYEKATYQNLTAAVDQLQHNMEHLESLHSDANQVMTVDAHLKLDLATVLSKFVVSEPFAGKRYFVTKTQIPFSIGDADYQCQLLGGYLAELNDQSEYDFVWDYCKSLGGDHFFTGGNDIETEGTWKFYHSGTPVTYPNWNSGQPDNNKGDEDCLQLRISYGASNDAPCDYRTSKFICEIPA